MAEKQRAVPINMSEPYNKETREIYMNVRQNKDNPSTNSGWENGIPKHNGRRVMAIKNNGKT